MKMKWLGIIFLLSLGVTRLSAQAAPADTLSPPTAEIAVVKAASKDNGATWLDAQLAPGLSVHQGDPIYYLIQIVNTGDVPVTALSVTDNQIHTETCEIPDTLEPDNLVECQVGPIPAPAGQSVNPVRVTAEYNGEVLTVTDSVYVYAGEAAVLSVEKMAGIGGTWYTADTPPGFSVPANREVRFRVVVTNEGTYPFTNIVIADTMLIFRDCEIPDLLPAGQSFQCSTKRIEVGTGAQLNTVTVSAVADGQTYAVSDAANFVAAAEINGDIFTVEGPVVSLEGNVITVAQRTIVLRRDDPVLSVLAVGDPVRVEASEEDDGVLIALFILIVDTDVYVGSEPDDIYRDNGNCGNPPPAWAPAHGWRHKCQLIEVTPGMMPPGLREKNNGRGNGSN